MKKYRVGVIGATGMVGQRFVTLLQDHPWFELAVLAASENSAGKTYQSAVAGRWAFPWPVPEKAAEMTVYDAADVNAVASQCDFVFCAVNMDKAATRALEERYAKAETPVVSNNSACRAVSDVPMLIPEINAAHAPIIAAQRRRLGTRRGFVAVKPNCSIQSYVPALTPLRDFGIKAVSVCTYQAISGAGKTFDRFPEILDNVIPYIGGEEEKSEQEPLKIWGELNAAGDAIVPAAAPTISAQCIRPRPSCAISRSRTGPSPGWIGSWRRAWPCLWAGCGGTICLITSSFAFPITPCGARQAARCSWPSCFAPRAISRERSDPRGPFPVVYRLCSGPDYAFS